MSLRTKIGFFNREQGQSFIEFALLAPILVMLLAGAIDMGRLYYYAVAANNAARTAASYLSLKGDTTGYKTAADNELGAISGTEAWTYCVSQGTPPGTCPSCSNNDPSSPGMYTVTVTVQFSTYTFFVGNFFPDGKLKSTVTYDAFTEPDTFLGSSPSCNG